MPDSTTTDAPTTDTTATATTTDTVTVPDPAALESEVTKWRDLARKHEERAKANAAAVKELDELKKQSMTDIEKAVATARTEGETNATRKASAKVAAAEIRAAAAGRLDDSKIAALLEGIDLGKFVDDDGEVDTAKVTKFVDGIAPTDDGTPTVPDLGQGARGSTAPLGSDPLLASLKATLGI